LGLIGAASGAWAENVYLEPPGFVATPRFRRPGIKAWPFEKGKNPQVRLPELPLREGNPGYLRCPVAIF